MRKIFLPLIIFLSFLVCESVNAQRGGGGCDASAGSLAITSATGNGCPGNNSTLLTLSGTIVGNLQWLYSIDGVTWLEIVDETGTSYTANDLNVTTRYAVRARIGLDGLCSDLSNVVTITIATPVWYKDVDDDDYSDGITLTQCAHPGANYKSASQLTATTGDCNDDIPSIHPDAPEVFDGVDNNCDGAVDEGFHDYIIPAGISSISLTVQGAKGGSIKRQTVSGGIPQGPLATLAAGGSGAKLNAKFKVETDCQQGLKPGGKLRLIIGATPDAIVRINQIPNPPGGTPPVSSGQGGGGGSAILYQAPGTTEWIVLAVAGGGGGAFSRADGLNSLNSPGIAAIQQSFAVTTGVNGLGGEGFNIQQEIPDGDPRDGGQIITINISGGGGGAFGDATQNCGGKKGMDEGGTSTLCSNGKAGGYGFGAGGSGLIRMDDESTPLSEEGGGGGGGGYSGGNGGEHATGGYGGGSYISNLAFESSWLTSTSADNGSISLTTNDDDECCNPDPPVFTGTFATVILGCNPTAGEINTALGTASATDACGTPIITSIDDDIITDGCNHSQTRIFTATDASGITSTASRTITWTEDIIEPTVTKGNIASCYKTVTDAENAAKAATSYSDNCSTNDQLNVSVYTEGTCSASITVTVTDACNNSSSVLYTTKIDDIAPVLSDRPDISKINCPFVIPDPPLITANDNCDGAVTVTFNQASTQGSDPAQSSYFNYTVTRTWSASDACGNTVAHIQTITMEDKIPPFLPCPGNVNVSTDAGTCYADVDFNLNGIDFCGMGNTIYYLYYGTNEQQVIGSPWRFDVGSYTVTVVATDVSGNSSNCTIALTVRDTEKPTVNTKNITVQLNAAGNATISNDEVNNGSSDNCTPQANLIFETNIKSFSCSDIGSPVTVTLKVTDASGNTAITTATVTVEDNTPPTVNTKNATIYLNANGQATLTVAQVNNNSTDNCSIPGDGYQLSKTSFDCSDVGPNAVTLKVTDANGNTATATATVTVVDNIPPTVNTQNVTIYLNATGQSSVTAVQVNNNSTDNCSIPSNGYQLSKASFDCSNVGPNTLILKVTDANGNTATATATVTVVDNIPPTVNTQNVTIYLNAAGQSSVTAIQVNNNSTDNCSIPSNSYQLSKTSFDCSNVGSNTVTLKVTDANGNTATATATLTVVDNIPPTVNTQNVTIYLNANGQATLTVGQVNNNSSDNCSIPGDGYQLSKTSFDCSDVGPNAVTLKVTDANGNTATATATVTVVDNIPPTVNTQNVTIYLNSTGQSSVTAVQVNNNSTDNCSIPSNGYMLSKTSFDCSNVGPNTVTLKVTDANGNSTTATATVTVVDNISPTVNTQNVTIYLNANGQAILTVAQVNNNSTDNCSIPSNGYMLSKTSFDCSNVGPNAATLKVTDANGNTATATATVTVGDNIPPTVNTQNVTIYLNANGQATLTVAQVNNNSTDNCSIPSNGYMLSKTSFDCSNVGPNTVTLKVTDVNGNSATATATVTVGDNTPPVINNASANICVLSPANHKMRDVMINYSLTDNCGTINSVLSVTSDEPISGTGDGDTAPDWEVIDNHNVKLRAERSGSGDGRVYTITITATDASGNTSTSSVEVRVTHNITSPQSGKSFKVGSTVSLEGEFWDKAGNKHSATWLIDDNTSVKGTVTEPTANKNGKVTGSYKFTAPGVYKLQMNTKDQNNVVSYANTNGDLDAIIVIYDPNGGYTYGGGYFNSPAGAVTSNASATGKGSYGFSVNYFKGATYPKGETQFEFKVGEFEFNALNFEYMSIAGAKAQMKGTGKIIGGQSGINFILTVTDGQLDGTGIDKVRMKIYNKNTMEVYYDNQPGASDAVNPTVPVQENSTVVISGSNNSNLTQSNQVTTKVEQEVAPVADGLEVKVMPNPSSTNFRIVVNSNDLKEPVKLLVTDMLGRVIETRITNAGQTITIGDKYISGTYAVRILQGRKTKQLSLIKLSD